jgi:hypothetical protein
MSTTGLLALVKLIQAIQRTEVLEANGLSFTPDELSQVMA